MACHFADSATHSGGHSRQVGLHVVVLGNVEPGPEEGRSVQAAERAHAHGPLADHVFLFDVLSGTAICNNIFLFSIKADNN